MPTNGDNKGGKGLETHLRLKPQVFFFSPFFLTILCLLKE